MKFRINLYNCFCEHLTPSFYLVKMLSNIIQYLFLLFYCLLPDHVNGKLNLNKEKNKQHLEEKREVIKNYRQW